MWPRTPEEQARGRLTGFVCFLHRRDAEDALNSCNDQDVFNCGHQLMLRWGKNVRKVPDRVAIPQRALDSAHESLPNQGVDVALDAVPLPSKSESKSLLNTRQLQEFDNLFRYELFPSRRGICHAMAFAFEFSVAAQHITMLLEELLMDDDPAVSIDMCIARVYVMSDILYNSQQPGIRNAFRYRDGIEQMSPRVFTALGECTRNGRFGFVASNRLKTAVQAVLSAWTSWSVYSPVFIDTLDALFQGKNVEPEGKEAEINSQEQLDDQTNEADSQNEATVVKTAPQGDWQAVSVDEPKPDRDAAVLKTLNTNLHNLDEEDEVDGESIDGDEIDEGASAGVVPCTEQNQGQQESPLPNDPDGDVDDDIDGACLSDDDDIDGLPIDE
jgi:hypothetical protein